MALNLGGWGGGDGGETLGGMSQGKGVLASLGFDPEDAQMNPEVRARLAERLKNPYGPPKSGSSEPGYGTAAVRPIELGGSLSDGAPSVNRLVAQEQAPPAPQRQRPTQPASINDASGSIPEGVTEPILKKRPAAAPAQASQGAPPASLAGAEVPAPADAQSAPTSKGIANPASESWENPAVHSNVNKVSDFSSKALDTLGQVPDTKEADQRVERYNQPTQLIDTEKYLEAPARGDKHPVRDNDPASKTYGKYLNPNYGKVFKEYRPGFMDELKRGAANFAAGFGGHPEQATPYSAPNSRYQNLEANRTQRLLPAAEKSKADLLAQFKARVDALKEGHPFLEDMNNASRAANEALTGEEKTPVGEAATEDAKAAAARARRAEAMSDPVLSKPLNAYQRSRYIATGEMQPAHEHEPSFEEQEYGRQAAQWRMQHRGETMPEEVEQQIYQRVHGRAGEAAVEGPNGEAPFTVQQAAAKGLDAVSAYTNLWTRSDNGMNYRSESGNSIPYNEYQAKVKELLSKANKDIARSGWEINDQGQLVKHDAAAQPAGGAVEAAVVGNKQPPPGFTVKVKASDGKMHWGNPATKEIGEVAE